jgi:hypothetical protein
MNLETVKPLVFGRCLETLSYLRLVIGCTLMSMVFGIWSEINDLHHSATIKDYVFCPYPILHTFPVAVNSRCPSWPISHSFLHAHIQQGRIQDFKLGGRTIKNCAERREARKFWGYFVWKITILRQKIIFFPILGGYAHWVCPPWIHPCTVFICYWTCSRPQYS